MRTFFIAAPVPAAISGQGVAVGPSALGLEDIESGQLVDLWGIHASYDVVCTHGQTKAVAEVETWLANEGAVFECRALTRARHPLKIGGKGNRCQMQTSLRKIITRPTHGQISYGC